MNKKTAHYDSQHAFTLIELIIGFVIFAILAIIALPNMGAYFSDSKIRRVAEEMSMGLQLAKAESIRRNTTVLFIPNTTGWRVEAIPESGGANTLVATRSAETPEVQLAVTTNNPSLGFTGSGRSNLAGIFTLNVTNPTFGTCQAAGGKVRCLQINVAASGQIRLCDPVLPNTDPRAC